MIRNFILVLFRNTIKSPVYSLVNILGLSVGLACAILILMWVSSEVNYNKCHKNYDHLYRMYEIQLYNDRPPFYVYATPTPLNEFLVKNFPEVKTGTRVFPSEVVIKYANKLFNEQRGCFMDTTAFDVLTIPLIKGDQATCLKDKYSVIMEEKTAKKYFGNADPIGRVIRVNSLVSCKVTAIFKELPDNTHFKYRMIFPMELAPLVFHQVRMQQWGSNFLATLVILKEETSIQLLEHKVNTLRKKDDPRTNTTFHFRHISQTRLKSLDPTGTGRMFTVTILASSALFLLLIACINFMNLATARSANRAREVGIRKVVGTDRKTIILQFLGESLIISFISFGISILLTDLFLPTFNALSRKALSISDWDFPFVGGLILLTILVGIFSGAYPAFYLARFQPTEVLKGTLSRGAKSATFRKVMVVLQFTLTIILIINTTFLFRQLIFVQNRELNIDSNNELCLSIDPRMNTKYDLLKGKLKSIPEVVNVTACSQPPIEMGSNTGGVYWEGLDTTKGVLFTSLIADEELVETFKLKIVEGRNFDKNLATDTANFLINETAARIIGKKPIVGVTFSVWGVKGKIIGVVKDFNYQHMQSEIEPLFIMTAYKQYSQIIVIRLQSANMDLAVSKVQNVVREIYPDYPFEKGWINDIFEATYQGEKQLRDILKYFTIIALFISCLGLLALSSYISEQQSKVMVIHKIHGASFFQILVMMMWEFGKWVVLSACIAVPIALFTVSQLFKSYAYHTPISAWVFLLACLGAILIAALTVLYQAIKTARRNPVDYLKYE
ncbi:MAG: ABC transporter permease [bacterium]